MAEVDRFGNPVKSASFPLRRDVSAHQSKAILNDHIADICAYALRREKNIVIENLDFAQKKSGLREKGGKYYARMLSKFLYSQFHEGFKSHTSKVGVRLSGINPAYTSVIGSIKYNGHFGLSSHERAAVVIARRYLRFSERPKTHGTRRETASILGEHDPHAYLNMRKARHVWSYYSYLNKTASESIRSFQTKMRSGNVFFPQRPSAANATLGSFVRNTWLTP